MKVVMKELGAMDVQKYSSELNQEYVLQRTMQEIVESMAYPIYYRIVYQSR